MATEGVAPKRGGQRALEALVGVDRFGGDIVAMRSPDLVDRDWGSAT
jgi:hypothetical protein